MVEVFITDIQTKSQAEAVLNSIQNENTDLKVNFDLNETEFPFPCGHSILRVEGCQINSEKILLKVSNLGFKCGILEDKICSTN
jgi:hypothetical protein